MTSSRNPCLGEPLTDRQVEILDLVSRGLSGVAVGRRLFLTPDTVKSHLRVVYRKLGVVDRAHAVRVGFQLGYLTLDEPVQRAAS